MIDNVKGNEDFNSGHLVSILQKWRNVLLIIVGFTILASVIFTTPFFITPLFKSTVVLFPTSSNSISKALLGEQVDAKQDILQFGEDEQTEQMLQILNSNLIRDRIVKRYNLLDHYNIDPKSKYVNTRLFNRYDDNIKFKRTEYMAVKITVFDEDPQMAADIANDISSLYDSTMNVMQKQRATKGFQIVEAEYNKLQREISAMEDSLTKIREFGVHDYETQAEMINQQLAIELAEGDSKRIKRLEKKLDLLAKYGGAYVSLRDALEHEKKQLSLVKAKYDEAKIDAEEVLPQKFVVNYAYKAERKSYPIRWVIVIISTISVFLFSVLILLILDYFDVKPILKPQKKKS